VHLLLQRADRCRNSCQLTLNAITPEGEHAQLAFLVGATPAFRVAVIR
jgi:hypothetical protein